MFTFTKIFRIFLIVFTIFVLGFTVYDLMTFEIPPPSFYSIRISADQIISEFEQQGFNFTEADSVYGQPLLIGLSSDGDAIIHLIGPKKELVNVKIVIRLAKKFGKMKLQRLRRYLERMIGIMLPEWKEGRVWLEDNALDMTRGGTRVKTIDDIQVSLTVSSKKMIMGLSFGDWKILPAYNSKNMSWRTP